MVSAISPNYTCLEIFQWKCHTINIIFVSHPVLFHCCLTEEVPVNREITYLATKMNIKLESSTRQRTNKILGILGLLFPTPLLVRGGNPGQAIRCKAQVLWPVRPRLRHPDLPQDRVCSPGPSNYLLTGTGGGRERISTEDLLMTLLMLFTVTNCKLLFKISQLKIPRHLATGCQPDAQMGALTGSARDSHHSVALGPSPSRLRQEKHE